MKLIFTFIVFTFTLLASQSSDNIKIQILEKIITEIYIDKKIEVWSDNKNILAKLKEQNKLSTTNNCEEATVIILESHSELIDKCSTKYIFVLNYQLLSDIPQSFGALFWKKGRPNIVIVEPRIKSQSIAVSDDLKPYLEETVW